MTPARHHLTTSRTGKTKINNGNDNESLEQGRGARRKGYSNSSTKFGLEGWGQSLHFCRYPQGSEPMAQAIARHEHYMAFMLGLKPGMTVLDVGCGVGGPGKEIAAFFASGEGVGEEVVEFVQGVFMNIPFPDNTFDAVYAMEATVSRVLKQRGRFGVYEWVMTDSFDASVPRHIAIRTGIEKGNGIASLRTAVEARSAMEKSFSIQLAENLAERKDTLPWWYFCSGDTKFAFTWREWGQVFRMTALGRVLLDIFIRLLEILGVTRKGSARIVRKLVKGADSIVEGEQKVLFTPMYFMIGEKKSGVEAL
ncbi:S-adenosyl-L-methionine-dependent methyltransferase [Clohesyomyces aquaticus]|uniref:S-adenosyl-L-methionine-dependent methyltransferase n=1 Tax=Clohesyomyces aquaticus TaxID=1231657 RepID=A0A1Y1Z276_9PLEO|nr:S-adenosyl-L-methionine-dependent methyltransferase [Clohesyomyces aquaticus]